MMTKSREEMVLELEMLRVREAELEEMLGSVLNTATNETWSV